MTAFVLTHLQRTFVRTQKLASPSISCGSRPPRAKLARCAALLFDTVSPPGLVSSDTLYGFMR